jgi:hypothetical protein
VKFVISDDEHVSVWLDLLGGEVGSTRTRQAKERETTEAAAAAAGGGAGEEGGDGAAAAGEAMETDD